MFRDDGFTHAIAKMALEDEPSNAVALKILA